MFFQRWNSHPPDLRNLPELPQRRSSQKWPRKSQTTAPPSPAKTHPKSNREWQAGRRRMCFFLNLLGWLGGAPWNSENKQNDLRSFACFRMFQIHLFITIDFLLSEHATSPKWKESVWSMPQGPQYGQTFKHRTSWLQTPDVRDADPETNSSLSAASI